MTIRHSILFRFMPFIVSGIVYLTPISRAAEIVIDEDFSVDPTTSEILSGNWNLCQAFRYLNTPETGDDSTVYNAYRLGTDGFHGTINCGCQRKEGCLKLTPEQALFYTEEMESDEETELVPLPYADTLAFQAAPEPGCEGYTDDQFAHPRIVQKNEIRLWKDSWPEKGIGYWHSIRFRIEGDIARCGSMRWVGGQIKAGDMDGSPVIAQRFDNGVFHITIEVPKTYAKEDDDDKKDAPSKKSKTTRFIVAKSIGNPDAGSYLQPDNEGTITCDLDKQQNVSDQCINKGIEYTNWKALPSIEGDKWIEMDYYVRLSGPCNDVSDKSCNRELEIWAQGEKVARIEGSFGASDAHIAPQKFKIGVYRDLQVGEADLIIDNYTLRKDPGMCWKPSIEDSQPITCERPASGADTQ